MAGADKELGLGDVFEPALGVVETELLLLSSKPAPPLLACPPLLPACLHCIGVKLPSNLIDETFSFFSLRRPFTTFHS